MKKPPRVYFFNEMISEASVKEFQKLCKNIDLWTDTSPAFKKRQILIFQSGGGCPWQASILLILFQIFDKIIAGDLVASSAVNTFLQIPIEKRYAFPKSVFRFHESKTQISNGWFGVKEFKECQEDLEHTNQQFIRTLTQNGIKYNLAKDMIQNRDLRTTQSMVKLGLLKKENIMVPSDIIIS